MALFQHHHKVVFGGVRNDLFCGFGQASTPSCFRERITTISIERRTEERASCTLANVQEALSYLIRITSFKIV
jgi:hypothetical protein